MTVNPDSSGKSHIEISTVYIKTISIRKETEEGGRMGRKQGGEGEEKIKERKTKGKEKKAKKRGKGEN